MATFDALPGNHVTVATHAQKYLVTADAINRAAADLVSISNQDDSVGQAFTAIRDLALEVSRDIQKAEQRYRQTATALGAYATALGDAQEKALKAAADAGDSQDHLRALSGRRPELEEKARLPDPDQLANQRALDVLDRQIHSAQAESGSAEALYNQAVSERDEAAERAAALINDVVKDSPLNDGIWDNVVGVADGIGHWIEGVLGPILKTLVDIATTIGKLLLAAIIVIALVVLLVAAVLLIAVLFPALAPFLVTGAMVLAFLAPLLAGAIVGLALAAMINESGTPRVDAMGSPETFEYPPRAPGTSDYGTGANHRDPYYDLFAEQSRIDGAGDVDGDGVADVGVISVVKVVGDDGVTRWRVQIPSTQEWSPFATDVPNDLNSDLVSKLNPSQRTQLMKAVDASLVEAGYVPGSGDPLLLGGFSLGGITAGKLAGDPGFTSRFNVQAVVTGGAPLDDVYIPARISVVSLEHNSDPVANGGDLFAGHQPYPNRVVFDVPAPTTVDKALSPEGPAPVGHGSADYAASAKKYISDSKDPRMQDFRDSTAEFFGTTETSTDYAATRG